MRRRRRKSLPQTPLSLHIEKMSHEGRGIAHHEGKVVFVEGALTGEAVEAQLTSRRDSFDEAKVLEIIQPSSDRVEPPCEYAGICGGCSLQHMQPQAQLSFKEAVLYEKLEHEVGDHTFEHLPALTGPVQGYRRKARLAVRYVHKKEQVLVGFREKHSSFITHMESCEVLDPRISGLLPALSTLIGELKEFRQIPQIEVAAGDPDLDGPSVAMVFRHLTPLPASDQDKLQAFAVDKAIALYLQPGGMDTIHRVVPDSGMDRLYYRLPEFDLTMAFHPTDFTQVNADINRKMISRAIELLALSAGDIVLDLFCGLGNFTLPVARRCLRVTGVEGADVMVDRGYENASNNGIGNAAFYCADLTKLMSDMPWMTDHYTKVLLDPPRSGAFEILPDILSMGPERIVYVSCNPATLARDAGFLTANGYSMRFAGAMDMFPHTAHVEAMALFIKSS